MSNYLRTIILLSLALLVVFGWHFGTVFGFFGTAPETRSEFFIRIGIIFVAFLATSAITAVMMAKRNEDDVTPDEREEKILFMTERVGLVVIYIGLLLVMWFAFTPMTPMQIANAILGVVCVSELAKIAYGLFILKRPI